MDRLTKPGYKFDLLNVMQGLTRYAEIDEILTRLAAYEDTGLEPEEIEKLVKAQQDGRLAVLPCKVGDTVFRACGGKVEEWEMSYGIALNVRDDFGKTVFLTHAEAESALKSSNATQNI